MSVDIERTVVYERKEAPERVGGRNGILIPGTTFRIFVTDDILHGPMEIEYTEQGEPTMSITFRPADVEAFVAAANRKRQ